MKDKLRKNGHKKLYYRLKGALSFFLFALAITGAAALPVAISIQVSSQLNAEQEDKSVVSSSSSLAQDLGSSSSQMSLLSAPVA